MRLCRLVICVLLILQLSSVGVLAGEKGEEEHADDLPPVFVPLLDSGFYPRVFTQKLIQPKVEISGFREPYQRIAPAKSVDFWLLDLTPNCAANSFGVMTFYREFLEPLAQASSPGRGFREKWPAGRQWR